MDLVKTRINAHMLMRARTVVVKVEPQGRSVMKGWHKSAMIECCDRQHKHWKRGKCNAPADTTGQLQQPLEDIEVPRGSAASCERAKGADSSGGQEANQEAQLKLQRDHEREMRRVLKK